MLSLALLQASPEACSLSHSSLFSPWELRLSAVNQPLEDSIKPRGWPLTTKSLGPDVTRTHQKRGVFQSAQGGEAGVLSLPPSTGHLAPAGGRAVTHPDTGCWVTATEAPHWRPSRSGGSGGAGLTAGGRCLGSPWHPFSLRQRPVGRLGSVPPQVTCFPARDSPGWGSGQPGLSIHAGQLSTACCSPCQRGAGACPRSHSQLTSE